MKRFLLLTTFENETDGHRWMEFSMHPSEIEAKAKKLDQIEASEVSMVKVKSSVVLKVKEVG